MAKLESIEHKIFASEAPLDEIGQFGSALDTTKLNTKDVTTIQALPAYTKGWGSAIISDNNYPTMEEMNGVLNVMSYHTGYLYQEGMPAWRSDREYSATSIVKEPTGTKFFHSLKDGNIGNTLDNTEYWEELKFGGSGLEVCDIGMALYIDETKGLRRYLNGQIVDINTNTQAFLNRLLQIQTTNPDYFTTEDNWQAEALLNIDGCVYKFVLNYDSAGTNVVSVRLPKYPDYVEINAGGVLPVVGNGITLGWTDGTGTFGTTLGLPAANTCLANTAVKNYGSTVGSSVSQAHLTTDKALGITTDPTKSGIQTTLKQTKLKMRYFIQIATGSETENNIVNDIELNNPYSLFDSKYSDHELNNLSWLKSEGQWNTKAVYPNAYDKLLKVYNGTETVEGLSVKLSTEDYTDYDFVLNTADETFRLPLLNGSEDLVGSTELRFDSADTGSPFSWIAGQNGHIIITFSGNQTGDWVSIHNATQGSTHITRASFVNAWEMVSMDVKRGDNVRVSYDDTTKDRGYFFYPYIGNGSLYFYVGETVQNANLIDAGRIAEALSKKVDIVNQKSDIVETYNNGGSGYMVFSNKVCIQWGQIGVATNSEKTVTLLKPYATSEYRITTGFYYTGYYEACSFTTRAAGSFKLRNYRITGSENNTININWHTIGFIA